MGDGVVMGDELLLKTRPSAPAVALGFANPLLGAAVRQPGVQIKDKYKKF